MAMFPTHQPQPNRKNKPMPVEAKKADRVNLHPVGFPTSEGDLGILKIGSSDIPRQTRAPSKTGDSLSNHVGKVASVMKKRGMLV